MNRKANLERLKQEQEWDILVIGGGATGLGIAVDAATRGYRVALVEKDDFAKGTSSRSTKLVHGGVRYLAQGNIKLVREALRERGILLRNAPHLTRAQRFIVPSFHWWEKYYYGLGLGLYDLLAGRLQIGSVRMLGRKQVLDQMPGLRSKGLNGGIEYFDGQFDDARLAIALAMTAHDHGACVVNYAEVEELMKDGKKVNGVRVRDRLTDELLEIKAGVVINATGVFAGEITGMDDRENGNLLSPSQGVHLVVDKKFFPGNSALMIPKTDDDRVLFAVPWYDKVVIGTTDTAVQEIREEPEALEEEISFIISHFNRYTNAGISREDVSSVFAGLRPLVRSMNAASTALISRDHTIVVSNSGLITIVGGKWTTYRKMAIDALRNAIFVGRLDKRECVTEELRIHGWVPAVEQHDSLLMYGSDAAHIRRLMKEDPALAESLHPHYPVVKAEVVWAAHAEMAMTVEDVLARRTRMLFLDADAAIACAPVVAELMMRALGKDANWAREQAAQFRELAEGYLCR